MCLTLFPGYVGEGKVWYPLLAHAQPYFCVVWFMGMRLQCHESGRQLVNSPDPLQIISVRIVRPVCMLYNAVIIQYHINQDVLPSQHKEQFGETTGPVSITPRPTQPFSFAVQKSCDLQYEKKKKKTCVFHVHLTHKHETEP